MPAELRPFEPIGSAEARLLLLHADADRRRAEWLPELEPGHRGQQPTRHELADEPDPRLAAIPNVGPEVHLQVRGESGHRPGPPPRPPTACSRCRASTSCRAAAG